MPILLVEKQEEKSNHRANDDRPNRIAAHLGSSFHLKNRQTITMTAITQESVSLDDAFQQAIILHQAGRLQQAEHIYRAILQVVPKQPDVLHNMGLLAGQMGQHEAGLPYLKTALELNPSHSQYPLTYADALLTTGLAQFNFCCRRLRPP